MGDTRSLTLPPPGQISLPVTMTATEIATSTPANASEGPNSKTASPVKEKTPAEVKEEATTLLTAGKRDLLLSNVPDAVTKLAQASELLSKTFGETGPETAETYFYYGKSLLELSRMESGVLGNALEGVPEEDADGNTSQFEDPAKMTDQEKDQVNEVVTEAFEENFKELEEKKAKSEESTKESTESSAESKDATTEKEASKEGEEEPMEEDEEGTEEEDEGEGEETGEETDEKKGETEKTEKEDGDKKDEEEEPSNLQLAWEMLELAKLVYSKQLEAGAENKAHLEERLVSTMLALGEVSIENENYKQAVEDIMECLKKQGHFPKDARIVAETHYQLGVAQGFNAQYDEAVESLRNAINLLKSRIGNLQKAEGEEAKKEVADLNALIPEIEEKIKDTEDLKKESEKDSAAGDSAGFGAAKTAEVKPISNIAVKRKAEEEDSASKKLASEKETAAAN